VWIMMSIGNGRTGLMGRRIDYGVGGLGES
jgi:hypothetical protein